MNITLVGLIKKMAKKYGTERADNMLAGMMMVHKDYFKIKTEIERYLKEESVNE